MIAIRPESAGTVSCPTSAWTSCADLIEEFQFFVVPKVVGGGLRALPDDVRLELTLTEHRIFDNGTVHLRYVNPRLHE